MVANFVKLLPILLNFVKLEFENNGFSRVRETGVPGEKPSGQGALCHRCHQ